MRRLIALLLVGVAAAAGAQGQSSGGAGGAGGGGGTVTSVNASGPASFLDWSGGPITGAGTLTAALATQPANTCFAGPATGADAAPTFRALVTADIPVIALGAGTSGGYAASATEGGSATSVAANSVTLGADTTGGYAAAATEGGAATSVAANSVALGTDTTGGYAASSSEGGAATSVAADSVALGTDTTGGYAGSSTEGGAADTGDSATNFFSVGTMNTARLGSGTADGTTFLRGDQTWATVSGGSGDFVGPSSSTDNAVVRFDSTTGKLGQNSDLTVSDPASTVVTVATTTGNALTVVATAPAATVGASQIGKAITLTASAAVASTDTAGAAAGGGVAITAGDAARNASGDANGGKVYLKVGAQIGNGKKGLVVLGGPSTDFAASFRDTGGFEITQSRPDGTESYDGGVLSVKQIYSGGSAAGSCQAYGVNASGFSGLSGCAMDVNLSRVAAGVWGVGTGAAGDASGSLRLRSGVTSKTTAYTLTATDSNGSFDNAGAEASVAFTLPAAANGLRYTVCNLDGDGLSVVAVGDDTITVSSSTSAAAGNVTPTASVDGACLLLVAHGAVRWISESVVGAWTVN